MSGDASFRTVLRAPPGARLSASGHGFRIRALARANKNPENTGPEKKGRDNSGDCSRLGLRIGKQHLRRAVDRSHLRRLVRESFRAAHLKAGLDVVFLSTPGLSSVSAERLRQDLQKAFAQLQRTTHAHS